MRRAWIVLVLALAACGGSSSGNNNLDSGTPDGGDGGTEWTLFDVDPTASQNQPSAVPQLAIAVRADDLVGMVWFEPSHIDDLGKTEYTLNYAAYSSGQVSATEVIRDGLINLDGVNLTFGPDGEPVVVYLGGNAAAPPADGGPTYWFQSDCAVSYRNNGTWTEHLCAQKSNDVLTGNNVNDTGDVVGLFPAVGVDSAGTAYVAYRDVHFGQNKTDYDESDWELAFGSGDSWSHQMIQAGSSSMGAGYGGHSQMVMVNNQPAIIGDEMPFLGADGPGQNVHFEQRLADGGWTGPTALVLQIANDQSGPSLAYDPTLGFAVAALDANQNQLVFTSSPDGVSQWTQPDPVVQSGTTGWYPSVAISPVSHDPTIAYYHCSSSSGVAEGSCPATQDELRIAERIAGNWNVSTIDTEGAFQPKVAFLSNGKRVILYRHPTTGAVRLRVEP